MGGNEEEARQQDRKGQDGEGNGPARLQGKDRGRPQSIGPQEEQAWEDREQEEVGSWQEERMDRCSCQGPDGSEDQGLLPVRREDGAREGPPRKGQGFLQEVRCIAPVL